MRRRRCCALVALAASGCETTQQLSAKIGRRLGRQSAIAGTTAIGARNRDVRVDAHRADRRAPGGRRRGAHEPERDSADRRPGDARRARREGRVGLPQRHQGHRALAPADRSAPGPRDALVGRRPDPRYRRAERGDGARRRRERAGADGPSDRGLRRRAPATPSPGRTSARRCTTARASRRTTSRCTP